MSSSRRKLFRKPAVVEVGCGCRRSKLFRIFSPKPKSRMATHLNPSLPHHSSSSSWERSAFSTATADCDSDSITTFSPSYAASPPPPQCSYSKPIGGFRRIGDSVAVEKDSNDPYLDFQQSILQMIVEKEIYAKEDLRELLQCFLSLNSPSNHEVIVRAFTEIWNGVFSSRRSRGLQGFVRVHGT